MLTLYTPTGAEKLLVDDYCVKELASGLNELQFEMSIWHPQYRLIQEESVIREDSETPLLYEVKAIDGGGELATVKAVIDLSDWQGTMILNFDQTATVGAIVNSVKPVGWVLTDVSGLLYTRNITMDGGTPLELLEQLREEFDGITYRFDNIQKTVTLIDQYAGPNAGASDEYGSYLTRELNLKKNELKGKSNELVTRLYLYGKDNLSFADINGGKAYVEDYSYSTKVKSKYLRDDRFTDKANMLAWATEKIKQLAVPQRSYDVEVADLARMDSRYSFLDFPMFMKIILIDETRPESRIQVRVVAIWRYPDHPEKNRVMLSTIAPRIMTQVKEALKPITASRMGGGAVTSRVLAKDVKDGIEGAIEDANTAITEAGNAKDTANTAKDTADTALDGLSNLIWTLKNSPTYNDFKNNAKDPKT